MGNSGNIADLILLIIIKNFKILLKSIFLKISEIIRELSYFFLFINRKIKKKFLEVQIININNEFLYLLNETYVIFLFLFEFVMAN